jgi:hypothetical protein
MNIFFSFQSYISLAILWGTICYYLASESEVLWIESILDSEIISNLKNIIPKYNRIIDYLSFDLRNIVGIKFSQRTENFILPVLSITFYRFSIVSNKGVLRSEYKIIRNYFRDFISLFPFNREDSMKYVMKKMMAMPISSSKVLCGPLVASFRGGISDDPLILDHLEEGLLFYKAKYDQIDNELGNLSFIKRLVSLSLLAAIIISGILNGWIFLVLSIVLIFPISLFIMIYTLMVRGIRLISRRIFSRLIIAYNFNWGGKSRIDPFIFNWISKRICYSEPYIITEEVWKKYNFYENFHIWCRFSMKYYEVHGNSSFYSLFEEFKHRELVIGLSREMDKE